LKPDDPSPALPEDRHPRSSRKPPFGTAALVVPGTPAMCGIDMAQQDYDALLTSEERAALADALPPEWAAV
jgi:hypothetical protein